MDSNIHSKYYFSPEQANVAIVEVSSGNVIMLDDNYRTIMYITMLYDDMLYDVVRIPVTTIGNDKSALLNYSGKIAIHSKTPSKNTLKLQEKLMFIRFFHTRIEEFIVNAKAHHLKRIEDELVRLDVARKFILAMTDDTSINEIVDSDIAALTEYNKLVDDYGHRLYRIMNRLDYTVSLSEIELQFRAAIIDAKKFNSHSIHQWFDDAILGVL